MKFIILISLLLFITLRCEAQTQDSLCKIFENIEIKYPDTLEKLSVFQYSMEKYIFDQKLTEAQGDSVKKILNASCSAYKNLAILKAGRKSTMAPITDSDNSDWLYEDKSKGRLIPWISNEIRNEKKICEKNLKSDKEKSEKCDCAVRNLALIIDYQRFSNLSDFQKGKAISTIMKENCK